MKLIKSKAMSRLTDWNLKNDLLLSAHSKKITSITLKTGEIEASSEWMSNNIVRKHFFGYNTLKS